MAYEIDLQTFASGSISCRLPVFWAPHKTANLLTFFGLLRPVGVRYRHANGKTQLCAICRKNQGKMVSGP
jgi:hypothetical protein